MALWGKLDQGAVSGTVVLTNNSASIVANSSTGHRS